MREILQSPDPVLHMTSRPVDNVDSQIRDLGNELMDRMRTFVPGACLGISAVQLGELVRVIAVLKDPRSIEMRQPEVIINPELVKASDKFVQVRESCLSVLGGKTFYVVKRHKIVKVKGLNINGEPVTYKDHDMLGWVFQHEIDHLNGILISDKRE